MVDQQPRHASAPAEGADEATIGGLVITIFKEGQALVQQLIALVKSELKVTVGVSAVGIGLFVGAAFFVLMSLIMLSFGLAYLIVLAGLHPAWGFLIVFGAYLLLAGLLAFIGVRKIKKVRGPQRTIHQVQETKSLLSK